MFKGSYSIELCTQVCKCIGSKQKGSGAVSLFDPCEQSANVFTICTYIFVSPIYHAYDNYLLCVWVRGLEDPQAKHPKSRAARPNSGHGKKVKVSISSPFYRRERQSQYTVNMGTRWTTWHQHQLYANSPSTYVHVQWYKCREIITQSCRIMYIHA